MEAEEFEEVYKEDRPWGRFTQFATENAFNNLKEIKVHPGQRLSLQSHKLRDEVWVFVDSNLEVEIIFPDGRKKATKSFPKLSLLIERGWKHRISNNSDKMGYLYEISYGEFCEDDIERFEDDYDRVKKIRNTVSREIKIEGKWLDLD